MNQPHKDENGNDVPCDYTFEYWATNEPQKLLKYLETETDDISITFAAEFAANIYESKSLLLKQLKHKSSIAREGALYGLEIYRHKYFESWDEITDEIEKHIDPKIETSPIIRQIAEYSYEIRGNRARLLGTYVKALNEIKNIAKDHCDTQILNEIEKCEKTVKGILDRKKRNNYSDN